VSFFILSLLSWSPFFFSTISFSHKKFITKFLYLILDTNSVFLNILNLMSMNKSYRISTELWSNCLNYIWFDPLLFKSYIFYLNFIITIINFSILYLSTTTLVSTINLLSSFLSVSSLSIWVGGLDFCLLNLSFLSGLEDVRLLELEFVKSIFFGSISVSFIVFSNSSFYHSTYFFNTLLKNISIGSSASINFLKSSGLFPCYGKSERLFNLRKSSIMLLK